MAKTTPAPTLKSIREKIESAQEQYWMDVSVYDSIDQETLEFIRALVQSHLALLEASQKLRRAIRESLGEA
jgi:hypothetical protein